MKPLATTFLCLLAFTGSHAAMAGESRYVQVNASAEVEAMPDYMLLNLQISDTQPSLAQAKQSVDQAFASLLQTSQALNLDEADIRAEQIRNYPRYQWVKSERQYTGEEVSRSVVITLRDLEQYNSLIGQLLEIPQVRIQQSEFRFDDPQQLADQALQAALLKARQKAKLMASTLDEKLGEVISIAETGGNMPVVMMAKANMAMAEAAPASTRMLVQKQTISASVDVRFELD
ncbi:SIMPL domain-containing protein [Oceanobacter mangrovi]|uniref:SIMPL domain-containing protein n=1 Tax=Oceanobacter mangrovi TaxID=2862510 RepID=UPI001C8EA3BB|nr:SIMPL domain-containing protein [Oceanobacter mangrovi]